MNTIEEVEPLANGALTDTIAPLEGVHNAKKRKLEETARFLEKKARMEKKVIEARLTHELIEKGHFYRDAKELVRVKEALESVQLATLSEEEQFACLLFPRNRFPLLTTLAEDITPEDQAANTDDKGTNSIKALDEMRALILSYSATVLANSVCNIIVYCVDDIPLRDYRAGNYRLALSASRSANSMHKEYIKSKGYPFSLKRTRFCNTRQMDKLINREMPVPTSSDVHNMQLYYNYTLDTRPVDVIVLQENNDTSVTVEASNIPEELVAIYVPAKAPSPLSTAK